jgi:hypothetical protein
MPKNKVALILLIGLISFAVMAYAQKNAEVEQEVVIQHRTVEQPKEKRSYTTQEINMIKAAKDVVKKYWMSSYEEIYGLLSKKYKERLNRTRNISNATEYKNTMPVTERVWLKQTYQKADLQRDDLMQIVVLAEWEEEGYEGVMTFVFDMIKESDKWKIENIMF